MTSCFFHLHSYRCYLHSRLSPQIWPARVVNTLPKYLSVQLSVFG